MFALKDFGRKILQILQFHSEIYRLVFSSQLTANYEDKAFYVVTVGRVGVTFGENNDILADGSAEVAALLMWGCCRQDCQ